MLITNAQSPPAEQFSIINPGPSSYPSRWNASSTVRDLNTNNFIFYNNETSVNSTFFINVTVSNVTNLFGWGIGIIYDNTTLQYVRAWLPTDNVFAGAVSAGATLITPGVIIAPINQTHQEVDWGASYIQPSPSWDFNGTGTMAQVEFQIIAQVNSTNPQLSSSFSFDPAWTDVYFWPSGSEVPTLNTGNFVYAWAPARSSTSVVTSPTSAVVGSAVNCTATVTGSNPTGTVTWSTNSSTGYFNSSISTLSSGTCSTTYTDTSPGIVTITANYSGDSHNLPSNGTTTLTVTPVSVVYTVTFIESGLPQSSQWSVTLNGQTNSSTSNSVMFAEQNGNYSYSVTGPSGFNASPSGGSVTVNGTGVTVSITFTVALAKSSTSVVCSPNPGAANSSITCTAHVTGSNPTGTVTWSTNSSTGYFSNSTSTLSSGTCSTTYTDTSPGIVTITANYSGDSHNLPSNGTSVLTLTVPSRHDVVVSSVSTSASVTQGALLPISVAVLNDGTATETLVVVNATADGTLIGSPQIVPSLPAGNTTTLVFSWNTTGVLVGTHVVTATVTPVPGQTDLSSISKSTTVQVLEVTPQQYYLTVTSAYGSPSPSSGWFDSGTSITESVTSPASGGTGVQYVCTGWSGTGSIPASGAASSVTFTINANSTITWNWKTQYYLTVNSAYDTPGGAGWYDSGSIAYAALSSGTVGGGSGVQYVFTGWSGDASGSGLTSNAITMNAAKTATANWKTQYYFTVTSAYDSASPSSGWFDSGTSITENVTSPVSGASGTQYVCTGWSGFGSVPSSGTTSSVTFTITQASNITWTWKTQFQVTFSQFGVGSDFMSTVVTVDSANYSISGLPVSFWWDSESSHSFSFASPLVVNASKQYVWSSTSGLSTLQNGTLTATASGSVLGNYASAYSHQMRPLLPASLVLGSIIALGLLGASVLFMFVEMDQAIKKRKRSKDADKSHRTLH
jgi:hypothetical protein